MAVWGSQRNQASQGLLNRGFRPLSVEHLFGIGACPGREPRWRAVPLRLGSRGHPQVWWPTSWVAPDESKPHSGHRTRAIAWLPRPQVWWHSHTQPQSGS